jgi:PD-(D/E)XK nuclease superfamily protein
MSVSEQSFEALFVGNEQFSELEDSLEIFCPFDAIGMVRQEIRHGRFLRYILDPQRPHAFGAECLRALMATAAHAIRDDGSASIRPLDVHLMELDSAWVPQSEHKSIDILIEVDRAKLVVAIELKIEAGEHSGQLARYKKIVETDWPRSDGWRHVFLFLTKWGDHPSGEHGEGWVAMHLEELSDALDGVVRKGAGAPDSRNLLQAYVSMLRREHLSDKRLEELSRKLWAQHQEALEFLSDRRPDLLGTLINELSERRETIAATWSERTGLSLSPDHSTASTLRFGIEDWDGVSGMQSAGSLRRDS